MNNTPSDMDETDSSEESANSSIPDNISVKKEDNRVTLFSLLFSGTGIGLLTGLSASPVVGTVVASVLSIAGVIVSGISGISLTPPSTGIAKSEPDTKIDEKTNKSPLQIKAFPLAILIAGMIIGSILGIKARNKDIFKEEKPDINLVSIYKNWEGDGLTKGYIRRRLFDFTYPLSAEKSDSSNSNSSTNLKTNISSSVLNSDIFDSCSDWNSEDGEKLKNAISASTKDQNIVNLIEKLNVSDLKTVVDELICRNINLETLNDSEIPNKSNGKDIKAIFSKSSNPMLRTLSKSLQEDNSFEVCAELLKYIRTNKGN